MSFQLEPRHTHGACERTAVLMINLGTPEAPTASALRRYLAEFLWDRRVVEIPRPLWWLILHGVILRTRPARSAAKYASIWRQEGSPLLDNLHTRPLSSRLPNVCRCIHFSADPVCYIPLP